MNRKFLALAAVFALGAHAAEAAGIAGVWVAISPNKLLTTTGQLPPLNAAAAAQYQADLAAAAKGDYSWDPVAICKPPGEPRTMLQDRMPFEIDVSPARVDFLFQWNRLDRIIGIVGKEPLYVGPYYFGASTAHWEGSTLVASVTGIKENTTLDAAGLPHTDSAILTERFHTINGGQILEADIHVSDPATYTRDWDTKLLFRRLPDDTRIKEDVCMERKNLNNYATIYNSVTK